jgi:hypothetical protein
MLLDSDVAELYGVETREINQAMKNNPDKFPEGYIIELSPDEWKDLKLEFSTEEKRFLRSKFLILEEPGRGKHSKYIPKAFTEKGLYMLATILKGPRATRTTIAIVETFTKIRELARTVAELSAAPGGVQQKSLVQKGGDIITDILGDDLQISAAETKYEVNFALLKITHTVTKTSKK